MQAQAQLIPPSHPDARAFRSEVRRTLRCPCDGISHRSTSKPTRRTRGVAAELDVIEHLTGERPRTCVWHSFFDPDVGAVLRSFDFFDSGQCREYWGDDPEWWLVEGIAYYRRVHQVALADAEKNRPKPPPPPTLPFGQVVEEVRR